MVYNRKQPTSKQPNQMQNANRTISNPFTSIRPIADMTEDELRALPALDSRQGRKLIDSVIINRNRASLARIAQLTALGDSIRATADLEAFVADNRKADK